MTECFVNSVQLENVAKEKFNLLEFKKLEEFLLKAFSALEAKTKAEKELINLATQVAHDIRSPIAALRTTIKQAEGIEETTRDIVQKAANRVDNIADALLAEYRNQKTKGRI